LTAHAEAYAEARRVGRGRRSPLGHFAGICIAASGLWTGGLFAQAPVDTVSEPGEARRVAMLAVGSVSAATWTQVIGMPDKWPRTWQGYGNRLGDQVGFTATEEVLRLGLEAALPWRSTPRACPGARAGHGTWARLGAAARCGVAGTFVARNRAGERRPNLPFIGAVVAASAASLSWRPERSDAHKGQVFLLTRVGISLGATSINRAVGAWRGR